MQRKKVLLALSGGVDSAVAAFLLRERGFDVVGAFFKMWSDAKDLDGRCAWKQERRDAYAVGAKLGIPVLTLDFEEAYRREVLEEFFRAYEAGDTPNPDILCNSRVKFPLLRREADRLGCEFIATGHYARVANDIGAFHLLNASDPEKDQTYFLSGLTQDELRRTLFPIGDFTKAEVRAMAKEAGLDVWNKRSTRGICFVGKVDMPSFLRQRIPERPGAITRADGAAIGTHRGLHSFTIGQRHGTGIGGGKPLFVREKMTETNTLILTDREEDLLSSVAALTDLHWIADEPRDGERLLARPRYRAPLTPARIQTCDRIENADALAVQFSVPQRALTPGQHVVFYRDEECLGGGKITRVQ